MLECSSGKGISGADDFSILMTVLMPMLLTLHFDFYYVISYIIYWEILLTHKLDDECHLEMDI